MNERLTVADRVTTNIHAVIEDHRIEESDPEFAVYQSLSDKIWAGNRTIVLTSADEIRTVYNELIGGIQVCDEVLGWEDSDEERRRYTMELGTLKRSADRLAKIMVDRDIVFEDAERDEHG